MTSEQAARYLLTGGFVAVELYRVTLQRVEKLKKELLLAQSEQAPAVPNETVYNNGKVYAYNEMRKFLDNRRK